jgi:hypothetical protein
VWWKRKKDWAQRVSSMRALQAAAQPEQGYGPSWDAILAGRREFAGLVLSGPWQGYEALIVVYGSTPRRREPRPDDFGFSVDYWVVDSTIAGEGAGYSSFGPDTLDELYDRLTDAPIRWYPPVKSLARVGLLFGGSGQEADLENPPRPL